MSSKTTRKFSFDDFFDFEQELDSRNSQPEAIVELPPAIFSEEDMDAAEARGFAAGHAAALDEAGRSAAHRVAMTAERIAACMASLIEADAARDRAFRTASFQTAVAALRKILPDLTRRLGAREIEMALGDVLREQLDEPRIVVRVADGAFDGLADRIDELAQKQGYGGKLVLLADAALGPADLRVEWADGGAERLADRTLGAVEDAIFRLARAADATNSPAGKPAA